jgi:hypothetical protein
VTNRREVPAHRAEGVNGRLTRREVIIGGGALSATGIAITVDGQSEQAARPMSDATLIASSELWGDALTPQRIAAMRWIFEFTDKQIRELRAFDAGDEGPVTQFRI